MPNIKSAKKRVAVTAKKNLENKMLRSRMLTAIKKFNAAIDANDPKRAEELLPATVSLIDSTASKGVIHKNNAANRKAAVAKRLSDLQSGKLVIVAKIDNKTLAAQKAARAKEARETAKAESERLRAEKAAAKIEAEKAAAEAEKARIEAEKAAAKAAKKTKPAKEVKEKKDKAAKDGKDKKADK